MSAFIVLLLILTVIAGVAYYYFTQRESKSSGGPSSGSSTSTHSGEPSSGSSTSTPSGEPSSGSSTSTLTIRENGTTLTENYQIMPRRENYIQSPEVESCYVSDITHPEYCSLHDRSTDGFAYVYDSNNLSVNDDGGSSDYIECPGGGHECWYTEKFDQNGNLVDIVDKNGVKLLDKMADDIWAGKWDNGPLMDYARGLVEYKDDKLILRYMLDGSGEISGNELKLNEGITPSVYFMLLIIAMKNAGQPKPGRIVLNVSGGKTSFDNYIRIAAMNPDPGLSNVP